MSIDYSLFASLKGEFEAEGLTWVDVAAEALFAARHNLDYLMKIGGCEAKSNVFYLMDLGVTSLVCPMIETEFAMRKYMEMLPAGCFKHVGVNIEKITAVGDIDGIIEQGGALTGVTIGRTDLTASWGGDSVESARTIDMVKVASNAARQAGLKVTMGGGVSSTTRELLATDAQLRASLDHIETRKAVIAVERLLDEVALDHALKLEAVLLRRRSVESERTLPAVSARLAALKKRM